ncbi:translation initiation factor IF-2-like [Panicum miliaceum]|uniref:Translation initiation factor IF-2-like n=1 Tax=Panicum miliaceum TaxID=4540 RepID=A0A3L6QVN9_PANMI|nr:translation initiation factor IF-2-like [Panicum miliaceum]
MADKISTIVLKVDLECERCYKKIRRVLCKIQDEMNIKTISFDEKSNAVTISGPFDAEKVKFDLADAPPAGDAKPGKAMAMPPKADLGPLLEKMMAAKAGPEPIAPAPAMVPGAAQGVAVPSIWPAPAGSVSGYGYNPGYDAPSHYGGGYGAYGCGCGGYNGYCRCGKPAAPGGYYGMPVYDSQGWYYGGGGRQPYYGQQQPCCEDPNAGCSVM